MSKESSPSLGDVVSAATFVIAVITAWLYTVGWTYVYQYFIQFRIPLLLTDLPLQHYLVYGGLVLWEKYLDKHCCVGQWSWRLHGYACGLPPGLGGSFSAAM